MWKKFKVPEFIDDKFYCPKCHKNHVGIAFKGKSGWMTCCKTTVMTVLVKKKKYSTYDYFYEEGTQNLSSFFKQ